MKKSPRFWIGVASKEHVEVDRKLGICRFCHSKPDPAKRLVKGDYFIYYSSKFRINDERRCLQFTAIGIVTDTTAYHLEPSPENTTGDSALHFAHAPQALARNIQYFDVPPVDVKHLVPVIPFITNKSSWSMVFRFGFLEIDQDSFEVIAKGMLGYNPLEEENTANITKNL